MIQKLFLILITFAILACGGEKKTETKLIAVSILPQKYFIKKIAGDYFDINVMVLPGESPATYSPTPEQMVKLSKTNLYFKIGHIGFEKAWMNNLKENNPNMKVIDCSKGIGLIEGEDVHDCSNHDGHHHHEHNHSGVDPHLWVSPLQALKVAENTYEALIANYPEKKELFKKNYSQLKKEIEETHLQIKNKIETTKNKSFLIFHPALSYLARDYGLNQIPIEVDGKEPGASHLKEIIDLGKKEQIKVVFIQKQFDMENAKTVAAEIGATVIQINPLDEDWNRSIMFIADELSKALEN